VPQVCRKTRMTYLLLIIAGFGAGFINALAGGGSFLTFPALVISGVPAVMANASSTVALVPGAFTSAVAFREDIRRVNENQWKIWLTVSLAGGILGAWLLLVTSDRTFREIAPWLLLFATLVFAFGRHIGLVMRGRLHGNRISMLCLLFPISLYGGYFGGGIGIMFMAAFGLYGMTDMHASLGMKAILGASLNAIAAILFIAMHKVDWIPTLVMMAAAITGGLVGPMFARRLKPGTIRVIVIGVGLVMTAYFFRMTP
jgi:uncharacterized protein